ncbi:hypothetical protein [Flavobacterium sp. IMCC34518]|uniref:hypothetical protein n=1 Tax=Flavobacterium sp. IMCC34518 TaxID=3003623 RepID=UPI0022AC465A|nr:hypothetical protein [Flavobacterium sp. IMCC34518]
MSTISSKDVFRPDRIWPFRFAYQLLYFKDTFHIFNIVKDMSPDSSENPFWAGVQPTKIVTDSGIGS